MANVIRIKRRVTGLSGAPASLASGELAYNNVDDTIYAGFGDNGSGVATAVKPVGGEGTFAKLASPTFTGTPAAPTAAADTSSTQIATTAFVLGQAGSSSPVVNGTAAAGTSLKYSREDHVHPTDTSRAPLASPTFTGTPAAPTAAVNTNTTQLATTAFVLGQANSTAATIAMNGTQAAGTSTLFARADHVHPSDTAKANLASPTFTGTPAAPTAAADTNTTQLATTAFVIGQVSTTTPAMDGTAAIGTSLKFARADHVHPTDTSRAPLASPTFTGTPAAPTAAADTSSTQLATTAFVIGQASSTAAAALGTAAVGTSLKYARADHVHAMPTLTQVGAPTADVSLASFKLTNVADPVSAQDAATKAYVDSVAQGLDAKASVRAASTANIATLSGLLTVDGVTLVAGDRVLVKNQTTASQNGIYVASATAWTRAIDMNTWSEVPSAFVFVEQGSTQADTSWVVTADQGGTLDTTAITWVQFGAASSYAAGNGLSLTGNTFAVVGTANRITVSGSGVDIASNYVGQNTITTLGTITTGVWNGTTVAVANGGTGATTLTGLVKGNGTSAFTAAVAGTDYHDTNSTIDGGTF